MTHVAVGHAAAADVPVGAAVLPAVHWHAFQLLCEDESKLFAVAELPFRNHLFVRDFLGTLSFVSFGTFAWGRRVAGAIDDVFDFAKTLQPWRQLPWATEWNMSGSPSSRDQSISDIDSALKADFTVSCDSIRRAGQEASDHKLVFLEGRDKAGVVLARQFGCTPRWSHRPTHFWREESQFRPESS